MRRPDVSVNRTLNFSPYYVRMRVRTEMLLVFPVPCSDLNGHTVFPFTNGLLVLLNSIWQLEQTPLCKGPFFFISLAVLLVPSSFTESLCEL